MVASQRFDNSGPLVQGLVFDWLGLEPTTAGVALYGLAIILLVIVPLTGLIPLLGIWWERKVAGRIQSRHGPNRVGPIGILQSLADGIKLLSKEDLRPASADRPLFLLAPYVAFVPVFAAMLAMPFGPDLTFEPLLAAGLFWVLAVLGVEVMGVILAGWASNNKWSLYGSMREACLMVSYEIPLGVSIIVVVLTAGTLNLVNLGHLQGGGIHTWLIFHNPFAFMAFAAFFVASLALNKRAPFDLPESESELVAGFHTEYSGLRFSFFFFAEYVAMFVVAGVQAALFLGAWHDPFGLIGYWYVRFQADGNVAGLLLLNALGACIFVIKAILIVFVQMWLRWTLPRPRIDQVLYVCVKVLLPFSFVLLVGAALWQLFSPGMAGRPWFDYHPVSWSQWVSAGAVGALVTQVVLSLIGVSIVGATVVWILYAWMNGGRVVKRLSQPAPM